MLEWYGPCTNYGRCLYWMHAGLATLHTEYGITCSPMAGTAKWRWDTTEWAFEWGGGPAANRHVGKLAEGKTPLPEMHCWLYLNSTREIIDFSLCELGQVITAITGEDWEVTLPDYIWCRAAELPTGTIYLPNADAVKLAIAHVVGQVSAT